MKIETIKASSKSYGAKRDKKAVKYIVIHYTAGIGDTARGQGAYFKARNNRLAGAHFFVDRQGVIVKSVPMNLTAWAVGGKKWNDCKETGGGQLYGMAVNSNSVSIELCDITTKDPSEKQIQAVKWLISYIRKNCPNAKSVIRHFDVNGKHCPATMMKNSEWYSFKKRIGEYGK